MRIRSVRRLSTQLLFLVLPLSLRVLMVEHAKDVEVLLLEEDPPAFEVLVDLLFLLLDGFGFAVDLLEDHPHKVHLALGEGLEFVHRLLALVLGGRCFETLHDFFVVEELFLLELALDSLGVEEL